MDCPGCGANLDFIESSRVLIKQNPLKDGVIELRKGVADISLGDRQYAQVRIRVGNGRAYIKGMAMYSDDIPDGYDVIFYIGNEFGEGGKLRGWGIDTDKKFKKQLTIIEPDYQKAWEVWQDTLRSSLHAKKEEQKMKKYLVTLSPKKEIPKDGWDAALVNVRMHVYAESTKEARETAVRIMKEHRLYCKVTYIRELKGE